MSRYPIWYVSESKGDVEIETMATPWLRNAFAKVERQLASGVGSDDDIAQATAVRDAMAQELDERNRLEREQAHEEALDEPPPVEDDQAPPVESDDWRGQ